MKNYVVVGRLNPNAINTRYGRPKEMCNEETVLDAFIAKNDEEADRIWEDNELWKTDFPTYIKQRLVRSKEFYKRRIS